MLGNPGIEPLNKGSLGRRRGGNMEGILGFCKTDCESLVSDLNHRQEQLRLKRRWLLGLPLSNSDEKKLAEAKCLPESFVRDDDVFCEVVKRRVEKGFGACGSEVEDRSRETARVLDQRAIERILSSGLDSLSNEGLQRVALLLTGGTVDFPRTRKKMKEVIKGYLPEALQDGNHGVHVVDEISRLLNNPRNAREGHLLSMMIPAYSHRSTAIRVLSHLEEMPTEALLAMHRKLGATPTGTPQLQQTRSGWSREKLIHAIRRKSEKMLSNVELSAPLAKALAIASLSSKLTPERPNFLVGDFDQFSPATKTLQNEIANAILLVKTKVKLSELKTIQRLLDPNSDVASGSLRTSMKKMLTGYLFECSDLDTVPKPLSEALDMINRGSHGNHNSSFEEGVFKEVDSILNVSAQAKQIVWDLLSNVDFDGDFNDAYMEELVESEEEDEDDGCGDHATVSDVTSIAADEDSGHEPEDGRFRNGKFSGNQEISIGENILIEPGQLSIHLPAESCGLHSFQGVIPDSDGITGATITGECSLCHVPKNMSSGNFNDITVAENNIVLESERPYPQPYCNSCYEFFQQSVYNNLYLDIQAVCDDMSIATYDLIGRTLDGLAHEAGVNLDESLRLYLRGDCSNQERQDQDSAGSNDTESVIIQAVKNMLPALSKSRMDAFKEILGIP